VLQCVRCLRPGGTLCLRVSDVLTRSSAGVLCALGLFFKSLRVVKGATMPHAEPERWNVAKGFNGSSEVFTNFVQSAKEQLMDAVRRRAGSAYIMPLGNACFSVLTACRLCAVLLLPVSSGPLLLLA